MQRQLMGELIAWKSRANRKPLLLKGARQTGKTWLLNEFAGQQYQNVIRFDFMLEPGARSLFDGSLDPKRIISQIELLRGRTITPTDTLIIFDEIQEAPRGITSLKYFNELAPEYHIVAAGSYMGLALRRENESFPVGKIDQLTMRPMGFVEFVRAVECNPLADASCRKHGPAGKRFRKARAPAQGIPRCRWPCQKLSPLSPPPTISSRPAGFSSKSSKLMNPILVSMHQPASSSA